MWGRFCDSIPRCRLGDGSMVALAVSERLMVAELRDAARAEHRGKVRARLLAMAHLLEGGERGATARQFGMSRNVLRIWVGRYNATGLAGLVDRHGGGAPARLTAEQRDALKERVLAGADLERDEIVAYRILDIRALAEREFGVRYSHGGMHRVLHAIGCAWLVPRPRHPKGEAEAQDEFKKNSRKWSKTSPASIPVSR
jgi:transposase